MEKSKTRSFPNLVVNGIFLVVLNVVLMSIIGYLTLDINANLNSRVGGYLLSFFISSFIVFKTPGMPGIERMLKFGIGFIAYIILSLFSLKIPQILFTGLGPCLIISLAVLFYGKQLLTSFENNFTVNRTT